MFAKIISYAALLIGVLLAFEAKNEIDYIKSGLVMLYAMVIELHVIVHETHKIMASKQSNSDNDESY